MLYALYCRDAEGAMALRLANREAHLAYAATTEMIRMAGPLFADDGETMIGSLIVVEAKDRAAVEAFRVNDPYVQAGLFDRVEIHPFRWSLGSVMPAG